MLTILKVLTVLCSLYILFDYRKVTEKIRVKDPNFFPLGPYNVTKHELDDVYEQLIDIKNFTFLKNPKVCSDNGSFLLLIIVSSKPSNFQTRTMIRKSWGKAYDTTKIVFLMGETKNLTIAKGIEKEQLLHSDIVQGNFLDAYRNMTYKHVMGLKWVSHHCPRAKYVLKTDDDVAVNSHELRHFLVRELSPWGTNGLLTCQVLRHAKVIRSESKWAVSREEYAGVYYPTYCAGWVVLYSADVVPRLLSAAQNIPYFWIDDVHITGVIAEKLGIARTSITDLILSHRKVNLLMKTGPSSVGQFLFGPPDLKIDTIKEIWKAIPK